MKIDLNANETGFLTGLLSNIPVQASAPDALPTVVAIQSILSKINQARAAEAPALPPAAPAANSNAPAEAAAPKEGETMKPKSLLSKTPWMAIAAPIATLGTQLPAPWSYVCFAVSALCTIIYGVYHVQERNVKPK